jgi:hypothetical protein
VALEDLLGWTRRLQIEVDRLLDGFELQFGYAPGLNDVRASQRQIGASDLPPDVRKFFESIDEVSLPDAWNGYFLGPAAEVVRRFERSDPGLLTVESDLHRILTIGSDGGGAYFALDLDAGGAVIRVSEATIAGGVLSGVVRDVAPDMDGFLEALVVNVATVVRGGEPPF